MLSTVLLCCSIAVPGDTIFLDVGSPKVNGLVYQPHAARVRVHVGELTTPPVAEWTNELTLGDSAGRRVMRWVTKGSRTQPNGNRFSWELRQTYDARTMAPLGYASSSTLGGYSSLAIDGVRVQGKKKAPNAAEEPVDLTLDRPGFVASASDLLPLAVGFKKGAVMVAPFWGPQMTQAEMRAFTVLEETDVDVEGKRVRAWKVEEHRLADRQLIATWWLIDKSPYMVYGEVPLPDGRMQRMTEVEIPRTN
jgi:hypothetical protein